MELAWTLELLMASVIGGVVSVFIVVYFFTGWKN